MIVHITVENLAIIERSQLPLGPGFTVLTGETGAGKSLLVDAIELALGARGDSDLVRAGASRASIRVEFDLTHQPEAQAKCHELGFALDGARLLVEREVLAEGRSICRVGGKAAPVSQLRQLGRVLVDLHGQHDHQALLDPESHLSYLDAWIGEPVSQLAAEVALAFEAAEGLRRKLAMLRTGLRDREQRIDLLKYQIEEIESIGPVAGEFSEIEAQLSRLQHSEKLAHAVQSGLQSLREEEGSALERIGAALKILEEAASLDPDLDTTLAPLRTARYELEEAGFSLRAYADRLESDPERLEQAAARLDALRKLRRKYGEDESEILHFLEQARRSLDELTDHEADEESVAAALDEATARLEARCAELTALRVERAVEFSELVQSELHGLAMEKARFEVERFEKAPDTSGADRLEFYFSANLGEPPRPLSKIASGGEISRVMLALKTVLAGRAGVPTLIFDEVDVGLGGRAAAIVARKLEALAQHYQIVSISHLPQIASRASTHFHIEKETTDGRVLTSVRRLSSEEREVEIARMLAGESVTPHALNNARDMLGGVLSG